MPTHPILGPIGYCDGKPIPDLAGSESEPPHWICRPDGWSTDFELCLPGDLTGPLRLTEAIAALAHRDHIIAQGRDLIHPGIELRWIDLRVDPFVAGFWNEKEFCYEWRRILNEAWDLAKVTHHVS